MNILFITDSFLPKHRGGTEVYIYNLANSLQKCSINVSIACFKGSVGDVTYTYENLNVYQIRTGNTKSTLIELENITKGNNIQLIHIQGLNGELDDDIVTGLSHFNLPIFYTPHLLNNFCINGGKLRYKNRTACDGKVISHKCQACLFSNNKSLPNSYSSLYFNFVIQHIIPHSIRKHSLSTNHSKAEKVINRFRIIRKLNITVIAFNDWIAEILQDNGIDNIVVIPQGVGEEFINSETSKRVPPDEGKFIWTYLGRVSEEKGIADLIRIFKEISTEDDKLVIIGLLQNVSTEFEKHILGIIELDKRIEFIPGLPVSDIIKFIDTSDCIVIPSKVTETGPLVLEEAVSRRKPVLVSEFIRTDIEAREIGIKFGYGDILDFKRKMLSIKNFIKNKRFDLESNSYPLTFRNVADQHIEMYKRCIEV